MQTSNMLHACNMNAAGARARTEDDGVELVGALVHVGQQDGAGLEEGEELRKARFRQR